MPTSYQTQIQIDSGCSADEAVRVENVMREDILHSTLDWLSAAEFRAAARKAYRLYRAERATYDEHFAAVKAQFHADRQAQATR